MRTMRNLDEYMVESLKDPKEAALYLTAAAEENDVALLLDGLALVAKAHGFSKMAKKASLSRMGLYKSISKKGNPQLKTFLSLLAASGLKISFEPTATA